MSDRVQASKPMTTLRSDRVEDIGTTAAFLMDGLAAPTSNPIQGLGCKCKPKPKQEQGI